MKFNNDNKVTIETLSEIEASAFLKFLQSEILRHQRDIEDIKNLIMKVIQRIEEIE